MKKITAMNDETDFEEPVEAETETEAEATPYPRAASKSINLDARRKVEIYMEERDLAKKLVDLDRYF